MPKHEDIRYMTVGKLKELLSDPRVKDDMLISASAMFNLTLYRPGDCCCWDRIIGSIDLSKEELEMEDCNDSKIKTETAP